MNIQTKSEIDLTVRSFAYLAKQMAQSPTAPSAQYEKILGEAEKHRSALRLVQRDLFDMAEQGVRNQSITKLEFHRLCETVAQTIAQAQQKITRIATRYAPRKLAA